MVMKQLTYSVSFGIFILIIFNCVKDKPLPTGYSEIFGDKEGLIADSVRVQQPGTEKFFSRVINSGTSSRLLLGSYQQYHSAIYLKFDNLPDSSEIHSAKLYLTNTLFDSTVQSLPQTMTVDIYQAEYEWENDKDPEQLPDPLTKWYQTVTAMADTTDKIAIELDTALVAEWTDTTSSQKNYGLWIDAPNITGMSSYYSVENTDATVKPRLQLIYTFTDSTGQVLDTTTIYANKDAFLLRNIESVLSELDTTYFYIGKGLAFRSFVKFDLSEFDTTIHVNRALMKIVVNKAHSIRNASDANSILIYRVEGESWLKNEVKESPATISYSGTLTDSTITFDVTPSIQSWISTINPNYGFLVRSDYEDQTLTRVAFYSSKSSSEFSELQPKLYLYYTTPPKQEF